MTLIMGLITWLPMPYLALLRAKMSVSWVMGYGGLRFGSLDKVIKVDDLVCLDDCKGVPKLACSIGRAKQQQQSSGF